VIAVDLGAARVAVLIADGDELVTHHPREPLGTREDVRQVDDDLQQLLVFVDDLVLLEAREAMQAHVEDGLGLRVRQLVLAGTLARQADIGGESCRPRGDVARVREHGGHGTRAPLARHEAGLGLRRRRRIADERDDVVDVGERDGETFEDVRTIARLRKVENGTARDDFAAMPDERFQHLLQAEELRLAVDERDHVDAEHRLERRLREQVVQDDFGDFTALQLDDDAHAVLVGLVAQLRDAVDFLVTDEVGNALEQARLVHLVWQLGDDDRLAAADLVDVFEIRARADRQAATTGAIGRCDLGGAVDDAGGRKIGTRHVLHELGQHDLGIVEHREAGVDDLVEVVRRNVGGHAHGDTRGTVDQKIREARRHDRRLGFGPVVVRDEIDRFFLDVREQLARDARHAHFGVTHGRRRIAVDRTEVALPVDEQVAHREVLRHAHERVVHGVVAVRVVLADDVADDARGFLVGLVPVVAELAHRMKDAAMHGLETVANVGQRAADDDAHGVVEIRLAHLVFEVHGHYFARYFVHAEGRKKGAEF
jgi:hypothetical protein